MGIAEQLSLERVESSTVVQQRGGRRAAKAQAVGDTTYHATAAGRPLATEEYPRIPNAQRTRPTKPERQRRRKACFNGRGGVGGRHEAAGKPSLAQIADSNQRMLWTVEVSGVWSRRCTARARVRVRSNSQST
jgi:hypothetical protein